MNQGPLAAYLDKLLIELHYLDFRGIMQLGKSVALELDDTFVPLKLRQSQVEPEAALDRLLREARGAGHDAALDEPTLAELMSAGASLDDLPWLAEKLPASNDRGTPRLRPRPTGRGRRSAKSPAPRGMGRGGDPAADARGRLLRWLEMQQPGSGAGDPIPLADALKRSRQLVVLGDPGSGKTTLVKWVARTYALGAKAVQARLGLNEDLVPIVVPAAQYAAACRDQRKASLPLPQHIAGREPAAVGRALVEAIETGRAFVLVDGLDEIPDPALRIATAQGIEQCLRSLAQQGDAGSRLLVTSRVYGYEICRIAGASHWQLAAFEKEQIERFVRGWAWGVERALHPAAPRPLAADKDAGQLIQAIYGTGAAHQDTLQDFAANPLLLTILALVQRHYGTLPELRVKLYQAALATLTESWNRSRSLAGPIGVELEAERTMQLWEPVALWMHAELPTGTAPRDKIVAKLAGRLIEDGVDRDKAIQTAESYLDTAARWACLLSERGPNVFGFMHQTFQEYLAARAIVREARDPYKALRGCFFLKRWHEVVLLAAGYLSAVQEKPAAAARLVDEIRESSDVLEPHLHRYLLLAAGILADRVPVGDRTRDATVRALIDAAADAAEKPIELADRIAALSREAVGEDVIAHAATLLGPERVPSWKLRGALCLLLRSSPGHAATLRKLARDDADADVRALATSLLLAGMREAEAVDVDLTRRLKAGWPKTRGRTLDQMAQQAIDEAMQIPVVQHALVELLRHEGTGGRHRAAEALQRRGAHGASAGGTRRASPGQGFRETLSSRGNVAARRGA
ncbi:MAG: NACHT domain-containing protein, partial [Deltaproteobacteria bacterium]|nr:NACHT domain-containing protein [Deltaproteobacteria bacterium]